MERKNKRVLIISILALILVVAGASYAYFSARITGLESASTLSMTAGTLEIEYSEGNEIVSVDNIYPRPEAWLTKTITLSGKNTTELKMNYSLGLVITTNEFEDGYLTYTLTNNTTSENGVPISTHTKAINQSGTQILGYGQFDTTGNTSEEHKYTLEIFFKDNGEDQNASQGAAFNARITVSEAGTDEDVPGTVPKGWSSAPARSLMGAIKNNAKNNTKLANGEADNDTTPVTMTIPGQQTAENDEGLRASEDDYGTSFYYRGAVENNYVSFGDMCWRIVRIDGNGNIKLVLYNYKKTADRTGDNVSNPCHGDHDANDAAYARYSGSTYTSKFNTNIDKNAYVGLKYGTPGSSTYEGEHNGNNLSTILTNLERWYAANLNSVDSKIATVAYCNDKTLASSTYNPVNWTDAEINKGYGTIKTNYAARERLVPANTASPVLTCPEGISRVEGKIGLLSADEVAYAGAIYNSSNTSYYLNKNASSNMWWSSSPSGFDGYAHAWRVSSDGYMGYGYYVGNSSAVRPAVSLKSTINVTGGTGSKTSPFTIE